MRTKTLITAALLIGGLASCGGSGGPTSQPTPDVRSVVLSANSVNVAVGATATLTAVARDASGRDIPNVAFTWKSSNEAVASVANGVVRGLTSGRADLTASAGGVTSAPAAVNVAAAAPFDLSLSADRLPVVTGTSASLTVNVARASGFTGDVTLTLDGLPAGASAAPVTVAAGQTSATVTVSAAASAPHSLPTNVTLRGASGQDLTTRPLTVTVRGPAGSVDTTFGAGGSRTVDFGGRDDYATAVVVQPDGRVLVAGYTPGAAGEGVNFAVARLDRDGNPDATFGTDGRVQISFGSGNDQAYALGLQADGKIVVSGFATVGGGRDFAVARLHVDGRLDTSFGAGGRVTTAIGAAEDRAYAVLVQDDGRIVVGGASDSGGATGLDFALVRLRADGQLDASFGSGGKVTTAVAGGSATDAVYALAAQGGGVIAVGGEADFMVARFTEAGALDASFSGDGKLPRLFGGSVGRARAVRIVTVGGEERLLLAGNASNNTAVARLRTDGTPDPTFGDASTPGRRVTAVSATDWDEASGVAVQTDGKLVLGGWANDATTTANFTALRLGADGQLDASFGQGGVVVTPLAPAGKNDFARAVALQPDDRVPAVRVILAGERVANGSDFAVTRLWP